MGGHGYDFLILINSCINWLLKLLGKDKMSFSKKVKNGVKKAVAWIGDFEQIAAELAIEKKYDYVICGHIHQPQHRVVTTEKGSVTYLNSGDWIENLTSLEYNQNEWKIYHYNEKEFATNKAPIIMMDKRLPKLNVVPDEVMFFNAVINLSSAPNLSI